MRIKVEDLNEKINNVYLGDITIVKYVLMDTTDNNEAVAYAEEYAKNKFMKLKITLSLFIMQISKSHGIV